MRVPIVALLLSVGLPLGAQERVPTVQDTVRANIAAARSDLRNLVVAQEAYFADHGRYAPGFDALKQLYQPSRGSVIVFTVAQNNGWAARLTRERLGGNCIMWVNVAESDRPKTARDGLSSEEGVPICDPQPELATPPASPTLVRPPAH